MLRAPRGTGDVLPPKSRKWIYLEKVLREISFKYNFGEIRTPVFEHTELFSRTVGESTDIVEKEMYTFEDKGGRSLTLRPEGTAPVARAFLEHSLGQGPLPQKLFYIGPMFRYEKPQAGRYREFHQYGAEILGSPSPYSDVEIIALAVDIAESLGLRGTKLVINSIGCPVCRKRYRGDLIKYLSARSDAMCEDCRKRLWKNPLRVLDCKNVSCKAVTSGAPSMLDYLCNDCQKHWEDLRELLSRMELAYEVDTSLVRGLDYYTKTVFELKWPPLGAQDAVAGGGRYDGLVEELGGKHTPGVGFAMGLERILLAVEKGEKPFREERALDFFVIALGQKTRLDGEEEASAARDEKIPAAQNATADADEDLFRRGFFLVREIRSLGLSCDFDPLRRSLKAQMKHADRLNARYVAILGEEELEKKTVSIRSMKEGWQKEIPLESVRDFIEKEVLPRGNLC
ncbi:MAG TPA: histidine--tRNA ligase [Firmicutes bacterium]|nr:histidine--tRNA ligase [Candidatus Fermentithermobacillaceae bacterium]